MKRLLIVALPLIASCTTVGDVKETTPLAAIASKKSAKRVSGCIADTMERAWTTGVNIRPTAAGYRIWREEDVGVFGKNTGLVINVNEVGAGSKTIIYTSGMLESAKRTALSIAKVCQK